VDCFHEGPNTLWIDPEECIDCAACVPECPEEAIFEVEDLPPEFNSAIEENAEKCKTLPMIVDTRDPLMARPDCKEA
jgi:ferredoxin